MPFCALLLASEDKHTRQCYRMANKNLNAAKEAKKDEFYTQWHDIEVEVNAYLDYNPHVFRDKTVLLPCDDPEWSNFTKFFALNFESFGLKKLISTSYAFESKNFPMVYYPSAFEEASPQFNEKKTRVCGKIFELTRDVTGDGRIDINDLEWRYLEGDGDFRSKEIRKLRDEADIIVTNPPFSLFREFYAWVKESNKKFLAICNKNCITYKEVFPDVKANKVWSGRTEWAGGMWFVTKNEKDVGKVIDGVMYKNTPAIWITNIDHGRRHEPLKLMTMAENLKYSRHKEIRGKGNYEYYDNYDALEVPYTDAIPSDYEGVMGVPTTFLDKYCPEQFELIGITENSERLKSLYIEGCAKYDRPYLNGQRKFPRILIRKRQSN